MIGITVKNNQFPNSLATFLIKIVTPTVSIKIFSLEFETINNFVESTKNAAKKIKITKNNLEILFNSIPQNGCIFLNPFW